MQNERPPGTGSRANAITWPAQGGGEVDLDALPGLAALEGWWLAVGVADATGSAHARVTASRLAEHLARESDDRGEAFRAVAATRLG